MGLENKNTVKGKGLVTPISVIALVVGLCAGLPVGYLLGSNGSQVIETTIDGSEVEAPKVGQSGAMGDSLDDGDIRFTVHSVKCGLSQVGEYQPQIPQGQFCRVDFSAENIGKKPIDYVSDNQFAFDGEGRQFSVASDILSFVVGGEWKVAINPGNTFENIMIFDIPLNSMLERLDLHSSEDSVGVSVRLN